MPESYEKCCNWLKSHNMLYVAKCNLGKVNLELMLSAVSPSLHMIRGGAPLEFAGANYVQPCLLAIVAITASVSESLDNLIFLISFVLLLSPKQ